MDALSFSQKGIFVFKYLEIQKKSKTSWKQLENSDFECNEICGLTSSLLLEKS